MVIGLLGEGHSAPSVFECSSIGRARRAASETLGRLVATEMGGGGQGAAEGRAQAETGESPPEARTEEGLFTQQVGIHVEQEYAADDVEVNVEALKSVMYSQGASLAAVL